MSGIRRIKDLLRGAYDGVNWYGPPLLKILDGLTAAEAAKKPVPAAHSIWEIVLHVTVCTREVGRRLKGGTARDPEGGYWPRTLQASDEAWRSALDDLASAHDELLQALDSFQDDRLSEVVGSELEHPHHCY
jgi:hypothetical protein